MRISIWQQFSSNHSSNFTAVGRFETPEKASAARQAIEQMLRAIYAEQGAREARGEFSLGVPPTDVEIQFSRDLGVEWNPITLDWAFQADWAVRQVDSWLVVDNVLDETHNGIAPVDSILRALGSDPMFSQELDGTFISVSLVASAPSIEIADAIYNELLPLFSSAQADEDGDVSLAWEEFLPPWEPWSEKARDLSVSDLFMGVLVKSGTQLELRDLIFNHPGYGLPGLLGYLRAKGCSAIEYRFAVTE